MKSNRGILIAAVVIVVIIIIVAAIALSQPKAGNDQLGGGGVPVSITENFAFSPADLTVRVGQNVTWTNNAAVAHSVVSDTMSTEAFSSGALATGQSFTHEFDHVGDFSYHCGIHPSMTGTIHVIA
jgi:plastocyanin